MMLPPHDHTRYAVDEENNVYVVQGFVSDSVWVSRRIKIRRPRQPNSPLYGYEAPVLIVSREFTFFPTSNAANAYLDNHRATTDLQRPTT